MANKNQARMKRAKRSRYKIALHDAIRLSVFRTSRHFYAQVYDVSGGRVLASASTLDPSIRESIQHGGNCIAAQAVGALIAKNAQSAGVSSVAFDRSGYRYHGRVRAFADAARENGLAF